MGEANGYFIIGFQHDFSSDISGYNRDFMMNETWRQELFIEAKKKGEFIKYPNYADINDPVPEFKIENDIILE